MHAHIRRETILKTTRYETTIYIALLFGGIEHILNFDFVFGVTLEKLSAIFAASSIVIIFTIIRGIIIASIQRGYSTKPAGIVHANCEMLL